MEKPDIGNQEYAGGPRQGSSAFAFVALMQRTQHACLPRACLPSSMGAHTPPDLGQVWVDGRCRDMGEEGRREIGVRSGKEEMGCQPADRDLRPDSAPGRGTGRGRDSAAGGWREPGLKESWRAGGALCGVASLGRKVPGIHSLLVGPARKAESRAPTTPRLTLGSPAPRCAAPGGGRGGAGAAVPAAGGRWRGRAEAGAPRAAGRGRRSGGRRRMGASGGAGERRGGKAGSTAAAGAAASPA